MTFPRNRLFSRGSIPALLALILAGPLVVDGAPTGHAVALAERHAAATSVAAAPFSPATQYLTTALDLMQRDAVRSGQIAWAALRRHAFALAAQARTPADTYPAIRWAVAQLGDQHSVFLTPEQVRASAQGGVVSFGFLPTGDVVAEVFPGSPAAHAGLRPGDQLATVNGIPFARFRGTPGAHLRLGVRRRGLPHLLTLQLIAAPFGVDLPPTGRRLPGAVGYLDLPGLLGGPMAARYAALLQATIRRIDRTPACGWVVDLRRDVGGDMWPMLAGVGPIVGAGVAGRFVSARTTQSWGYGEGQAVLAGVVMAQVTAPYAPQRPLAPVAVLTSRLTRSAGEALVVAFRGRPNSRSFGEPTGGVPTATVGEPLADGAVLYLTVAVDADRTGRRYDGPLTPDQAVPTDWSVLATRADPVLRAALHWLASRPACAA